MDDVETPSPARTIRAPSPRGRHRHQVARARPARPRSRSVWPCSRSPCWSGVVGAYLFLPSATIVVTPKTRTVGPDRADRRRRSDHDRTRSVRAQRPGPDPERRRLARATRSRRPASGSRRPRRRERSASGTSTSPSSNFIPAGSIVSTSGGIRFRTDKSITVGAASLVGLQIFPKTASVGVTAVAPGPGGQRRAQHDPDDPEGREPGDAVGDEPGRHDRWHPRGVPEGHPGRRRHGPGRAGRHAPGRLRRAGRRSGPAAGREHGLPRDGQARSVDPDRGSGHARRHRSGHVRPGRDARPVPSSRSTTRRSTSIAETRLRESVASGSQLVEDSIDIKVGAAVVVGDQVTFPVTATATQVAVLDPAELEAMVLGKTKAEATVILAPYGTSVITLSPDWVGTIPTFENRVELTVEPGPAGPRRRPERALPRDRPPRRGSRRAPDRDRARRDEAGSALPLTTLRRAREPTGRRGGARRPSSTRTASSSWWSACRSRRPVRRGPRPPSRDAGWRPSGRFSRFRLPSGTSD